MNHHIHAALVRERAADLHRRLERAHRLRPGAGIRHDPRRLGPEDRL